MLIGQGYQLSDDELDLVRGLTPKTPPPFFQKRKQKRKSKMPKNIRKTLRFSEDEFAVIQQKLDLANITFSEFARATILKQKITSTVKRELIVEVNKIGTNLNQIAKAVNQNQKIDVLQKLVDIEKELKRLSSGS